ncbi:hypothetical protein BO83DRAFT_206413 [Aspergillus eucalypticola CBS 122712]|uniref:Uncharacterized protein n=1 Tax=Aspergillus eucalypticola (strain CBS 122712 / IBT 29274) TaxID=1448314 RepID=A0A317W0Q3_ASPEC|nr:uncharacterized protein BO83DRAFT_206413 [Aspergillus eucalypticola CBS 122712]PWY80234.1 hypothetical protein BO83DRAFT_206413 [Aspergillus eucalypticola CBS 122712]
MLRIIPPKDNSSSQPSLSLSIAPDCRQESLCSSQSSSETLKVSHSRFCSCVLHPSCQCIPLTLSCPPSLVCFLSLFLFYLFIFTLNLIFHLNPFSSFFYFLFYSFRPLLPALIYFSQTSSSPPIPVPE